MTQKANEKHSSPTHRLGSTSHFRHRSSPRVSPSQSPASVLLSQSARADKPGTQWELSVEHARRDAELLQEEAQPIAPLQGVDKEQALATNQRQLEQGVQQQELVFLCLADHLELPQLVWPGQLGLLQLESDLQEVGAPRSGKRKKQNCQLLVQARAQTCEGRAPGVPSDQVM